MKNLELFHREWGMHIIGLINSERIFFKDEGSRPETLEVYFVLFMMQTRRNAYNRMLGMDLAFGGINSGSGDSFPYYKAKASNQQFIVLFERFPREIWQGYTNARNTSGPNTTDVNQATELAVQIQELLVARRGGSVNPGPGLLSIPIPTQIYREKSILLRFCCHGLPSSYQVIPKLSDF